MIVDTSLFVLHEIDRDILRFQFFCFADKEDITSKLVIDLFKMCDETLPIINKECVTLWSCHLH